MKLDVVITTYRPEGIEKVASMQLPRLPEVKYIVAWQQHENKNIPQSLRRDDIKIIRNEGQGISKNRNDAVKHCDGELVYFADDDISITETGLKHIIRSFEENPDTDVATFRCTYHPSPIYPEEQCELGFRLPKGYWIKSVEMAFKRKILDTIQFDERFGPCSGMYGSGEDELLHLQARKKGLKCVFFPFTITEHPQTSTGDKIVTDNSLFLAMGIIIAKSYPLSWIVRIPLKAYRLARNKQANFFKAILQLYRGAIRAYKI